MITTTSDNTLRGHRALWRLEHRIPVELHERISNRSMMLSHLLYCRGYRTAEEISAFFDDTMISHDPFLLPDMNAAIDRIIRAIHQGERVAIFGDFDCDGLVAAAILLETLRGCGLDPTVYIPERTDGHGLHLDAITGFLEQQIDLIITADCGISSIEEIRVARGMGMDVVVTDHHEARADGSLPDCITVDPTRHDSEYPYRFLCGAGVAYKFAQALAMRFPGAPDPNSFLDLVALGTVADVVPIRDENRSLVIRGLQRLRMTERPGLVSLFHAAGINQDKIDPVSVAFYLAPRINAANRMASPQLAYDLITATDLDVAATLAAQLGTFNQQRQALVAARMNELLEVIGEPSLVTARVLARQCPPVLMVTGDWPAGISGLLASKLVDTYGLPAFVGSGESGETVSVSARGTTYVRIDEILESVEASLAGGLFLNYGGHSRAGGFRVRREDLDMARDLIEEQVTRQAEGKDIGAVLDVDAEVPLSALTVHAAQQVATLAPFGMGFPEPLFLLRRVTLKRCTPVGENKHARCVLQNGHGRIDGIWFHADPAFFDVPLDHQVDVVFHLQVNEWRGTVKPEVRLRDWRQSD